MANLEIGIVGLPNVGKSTLFNALLKKQVAFAANYPFATIEPNVGIVEVPDDRLPVLAKIVNTTTIVPAAVEFYDIAGLVRGASTGEGLGNKFLAHIREVSAIVHVVRIFEDGDVIHVANKIDPIDDIKTIETELVLADLATVSKQQKPKQNASKEEDHAYEIVQKMEAHLNSGLWAYKMAMDEDEIKAIKQLNLLTMKPVIYVFNVSENQLENKKATEKKIEEILKSVGETGTSYIYLCAKLETDVLTFSEEEQKEFLAQYNLNETGLNQLIRQAYSTLGLISFLTAGEKEVRAWTIEKGTNAQLAAGVIHTDFIKHFIKADIVKYQDFVVCNGWVKARETGKVQIVGKDHVLQDGDVVEFKIGAA